MKKLTPAMESVVQRMKEGWRLKKWTTYEGDAYLQAKNGIIEGCRKVHRTTFIALCCRNVIRPVQQHDYPTLEYVLTQPSEPRGEP